MTAAPPPAHEHGTPHPSRRSGRRADAAPAGPSRAAAWWRKRRAPEANATHPDLLPRAAGGAAPLVAIGLLVALIAAFLWMVSEERRDNRQTKMIRDTLWVEQSLRFQLASLQENLERVAADLGNPMLTPPQVMDRAGHLVLNNQEVAAIVWRNAQGNAIASVPRGAATTVPTSERPWPPGFRPMWSAPVREAAGYVSRLLLPVYGPAGGITGSLEATLLLDGLLAAHVPWWIAEHYQIELVSLDGDAMARKSSFSPTEAASHRMSFDPPLPGTFLSVRPYPVEGGGVQNALLAVIIGLALLTALNLFLQHRHARRRLQAERALRAEQVFRKAVEDSITVGLRTRDLDGRVLHVNPAFCRLVGWPREALIGLAPPMPWWPQDMVSAALERHIAQQRVPTAHSFETVFQHRDGHRIDVLVYEAPLIDMQGRHAGWIASMIDISERKRSEARASQQADALQQTGRLITMGEMASTLAHELNQPLGAITGYATGCLNLARTGQIEQARLVTILEALVAQTQRAGAIIRHVHHFVRKREPQQEVCDLADIVSDSASLAATDSRRTGCRLQLSLPREPAMVQADRVLIEQVLLNLIRNAMEALQSSPEHRLAIALSLTVQDGRAIVSVADQGPGIAPEMLSSIFTPFATSKPHGMGMGLNICRSILEQHQGHLWFEDNPAGGATFLFSLPLVAAATPAAPVSPAASEPA